MDGAEFPILEARRRLVGALALGSALGAVPGLARAQDSRPAGPVRMVIPFGPGSGTDVYARMVAERLGTALQVPVVVDNRPGASGIVAAEAVAKAAPDGRTLLFTTNTTHAANPSLFKALRYDPVKDFAPITKLGNLTFFVIVPANSPYADLQALVAAARAAPGKISFGASNSFGTVAGSKLGKVAGVEFIRVNYKSSPQILTDMFEGSIAFAFVDMGAAAPLVKAGKLRALAVLADRRFPLLPATPTMAEAGFPGFDVVAWFGLFAPAGTPPAVVQRFNAELRPILASQELRDKGAELGLDIFGSTPRELQDYVVAQIGLWKQLTADAGLTPE